MEAKIQGLGVWFSSPGEKGVFSLAAFFLIPFLFANSGVGRGKEKSVSRKVISSQLELRRFSRGKKKRNHNSPILLRNFLKKNKIKHPPKKPSLSLDTVDPFKPR